MKHGLFDNCRNLFGPISEGCAERIREYLKAPTTEGWDDIHGILISEHRTLWQAIRIVDPTFPATGPLEDINGNRIEDWPRLPDPVLVARAIRAATRQVAA